MDVKERLKTLVAEILAILGTKATAEGIDSSQTIKSTEIEGVSIKLSVDMTGSSYYGSARPTGKIRAQYGSYGGRKSFAFGEKKKAKDFADKLVELVEEERRDRASRKAKQQFSDTAQELRDRLAGKFEVTPYSSTVSRESPSLVTIKLHANEEQATKLLALAKELGCL